MLNSQLVGDSLDESEQFADSEVELRRVGGVYWALVDSSDWSLNARVIISDINIELCDMHARPIHA